jgi:hypothetical protein
MYGLMNDILVENMGMFKTFAEGVELADVQAARAEDREDMAEDSRAFWKQFRVRRLSAHRLDECVLVDDRRPRLCFFLAPPCVMVYVCSSQALHSPSLPCAI